MSFSISKYYCLYPAYSFLWKTCDKESNTCTKFSHSFENCLQFLCYTSYSYFHLTFVKT